MGITVQPLTASLGAEITDVDARDCSDEDFRKIEQAWFDWGVILLRKQQLTVDSQIAFAERFGALQRVRTVDSVHPHPAVLMVTNVVLKDAKAILPDGEMQFHSDQCYYENPSAGTMLYAMEIPREGGDTLFADTRAAHDSLPRELKTRCEGQTAHFVYDYGTNATQKTGASDPDAPQFSHPVIRTHPRTGRRALFVNRLMTDFVVGLPPKESDALLEALFDHQEQERFIYRHRWRIGDVVLWDNRCVLHARTDFDPAERRMLQRVTIAGDRPY
jgi:taurine dioxygenase